MYSFVASCMYWVLALGFCVVVLLLLICAMYVPDMYRTVILPRNRNEHPYRIGVSPQFALWLQS